jgi:hypothetical protein
MNCPGSNLLLKHLDLPESDEPDYRAEGTAMHEAAAECLNEGKDAWEVMFKQYANVEITDDMANAVQVYLDTVRESIAMAPEYWVEFPVSSPIHELFYGTLDFGARVKPPTLWPSGSGYVDVTDLKGGQGIIVEVEDNPQLKYYAYGLIDAHPEWPDDLEVRLRIVQPRIDYHPDGVIREWWTTVGEIRAWVLEKLVPAMQRAMFDRTLDAGPWCRFCPAKLVCPMLTALFRAAATHNPALIPHLSNENLGRDYNLREAVKFYLKAQEEETQRRLMEGQTVPGTKLVKKKANRILPDAARKEAALVFGDDAWEPRKIKSPPEIEKLGDAAREWVKEHAYAPDTGLTVALESDTRLAVKVTRTSEAYAEAAAKAGGLK